MRTKNPIDTTGIPPEQLQAAMADAARSAVSSVLRSVYSEHGGGYGKMLGGTNADILSPQKREALVARARTMSVLNPLAKQSVALWRNYGVGTGIEYRTDDEKAKALLNAVWKNPANQCVFSFQGQRTLSDVFQTDGEIFLAIFLDREQTKVRCIDPLQITEIYTDPEDSGQVLGYKRVIGRGKDETKYYADWTNSDLTPATDGKNKILFEPAPIVYHVKFAGRGMRGEPNLSASLDWMHVQQLFMRDRVAIMRMLAVFVLALKAKGATQNQLDSIMANFKTTLTGTTNESVPKFAAGSMFGENENVELRTMQQETGADAAKVDGDMLVNMAGLGSGIFPQYFGTGNLTNYAQANSMEGPMFKQFEAYQQLFKETFQTLFEIILTNSGIQDAQVQIEMNPIIRRDTPAVLDALTKLISAVPGLSSSSEFLKQALKFVELRNLDKIVEETLESTANEQLVSD